MRARTTVTQLLLSAWPQVALMLDCRQIATIVATIRCEGLLLSKSVLTRLIQDYPMLAKRLAETAKRKLTTWTTTLNGSSQTTLERAMDTLKEV